MIPLNTPDMDLLEFVIFFYCYLFLLENHNEFPKKGNTVDRKNKIFIYFSKWHSFRVICRNKWKFRQKCWRIFHYFSPTFNYQEYSSRYTKPFVPYFIFHNELFLLSFVLFHLCWTKINMIIYLISLLNYIAWLTITTETFSRNFLYITSLEWIQYTVYSQCNKWSNYKK